MSGPWAATPQRARPSVMRSIEVLRMLAADSATAARLSFVSPGLSIQHTEKACRDLAKAGLARQRKDGRYGLTGAGRLVHEMIEVALRSWV